MISIGFYLFECPNILLRFVEMESFFDFDLNNNIISIDQRNYERIMCCKLIKQFYL